MTELRVEIKTDELERKLAKVKADIRTKAGIEAVQAGGHTIEARAKLNLDKHGLRDTGRLINSVRVYDVTPGDKPFCNVGSRGVPYANIHEFGGIIEARRAKYLKFKTKDGAWHTVKSVRIPMRAWLRPALDKNKKEILDNMAIVIERYLSK